MNKKDLVKRVSDEIGVIQVETAIIVDAVLKEIYKGILENDKVTFTDFGAFHKTKRKARKASNPYNGAEISVPAKTVVTFKMSRKLKKDLQNVMV